MVSGWISGASLVEEGTREIHQGAPPWSASTDAIHQRLVFALQLVKLYAGTTVRVRRNSDSACSWCGLECTQPRSPGGPVLEDCLYAASDAAKPASRRATSHFGGRPRRGGSASHSGGASGRTARAATSATITAPPHEPQHRRCLSVTGTGCSAPGRRSNAVPRGGHIPASRQPWPRPQSRQVNSAMNRTGEGGRGVGVGLLTSWVAPISTVAPAAPSRGSGSATGAWSDMFTHFSSR